MRYLYVFACVFLAACSSDTVTQVASDCRNAREVCSAGFVCTQTDGISFECVPGSDPDAAIEPEIDMGEPVTVRDCSVANGGCSLDATCTPTEDGVTCRCNDGFVGDGRDCYDVDECLDTASNGGCDLNAICQNTFGGRTCTCKAGFLGDGEQCNAVICGENEYVSNNTCTQCPAGSIRSSGDDASGEDTVCEPILCAKDEFVLLNVCTPCPAGTINEANDDASGTDTLCDAIRCGSDEYVLNHECVVCGEGSTNAAGDDASGDDTTCDDTVCLDNQSVLNHVCTPCAAGTRRLGGDVASGEDTNCESILCGDNEWVSQHECQACPLGTTNEAGDDAAGEDTECDPVLCGENEAVLEHICTPCPLGSINEAGDNAFSANTLCDPILCAENESVLTHVCTPCAAGSTRQAGDDASGDDTVCQPTLCSADQLVREHICTACPLGTQNEAGDDASGEDTTCDAIYCDVNEAVVDNKCLPCAGDLINEAGDDASGEDTTCECPPPYSGEACSVCVFHPVFSVHENTNTLNQLLADTRCETIDLSAVGDLSLQVYDLSINRDVTLMGPATLSRAAVRGSDGVFQSGPVLVVNGGEVHLESLTLIDGVAEMGAGLQVKGGTVTANNVVVAYNQAYRAGGGVFVDHGASASFTNSEIASNEVYAENTHVFGGGVYVSENATFTAENTLIKENHVYSPSTEPSNDPFGIPVGSHGGGIYSQGTTILLAGTNVQKNVAHEPGFGGGVEAALGQLIVEDSTFAANAVEAMMSDMGFLISGASAIDAQNWSGAGVVVSLNRAQIFNHIEGATVLAVDNTTIANSLFALNRAMEAFDGVDYCSSLIRGNNLTIDGSTFTQNTGHVLSTLSTNTLFTRSTVTRNLSCPVLRNTSGTSTSISTLTVSQSTFSQNEARVIDNTCGTGDSQSYLNVVNSTFHLNGTNGACVISTAGGTGNCQTHAQVSSVTITGSNGPALCSGGGLLNSTGHLTVRNSLLLENINACVNEGGSFSSEGGNLYSDGAGCAFGNEDAPATQSLFNMISTNLADNGGETRTLSLLGGSEAIDFGGVCTDHTGEPLTLDQRGLPRDDRCDAGAFEVQN